MVKLDLQLAQALTNLRSSADFRAFRELLEKTEREEMKTSLTHHDVLLIGRAQGRYLVVNELLQAIADAPSTLDKLKPK